METNVCNALDYLRDFPSAKIATVARSFGLTCLVLRNRIAGHGGQFWLPPSNLKLLPAEEKAICNYIDRLNRINLAVRAKFIANAANYVLKSKAYLDDLNPLIVGKN